MTERPPWTVQLPLVAVFVTGVAAIALGARDRGQDPGAHGLVQMGVGVALCLLAMAVKNRGRNAQVILVVIVVGAAALSGLVDLSPVAHAGVLVFAAAIVSLLTFPRGSRRWFEGLDPDPEVHDE